MKMAPRTAAVVGLAALVLGVLTSQLAAPFGITAELVPQHLQALGEQWPMMLLASVLLATGALLLGWAGGPWVTLRDFPDRLPRLEIAARPIGLALLAAAAATLALLCWLVARGSGPTVAYPVLLVTELGLAAAGLRACDATGSCSGSHDLRVSRIDIAWAAAVAATVGLSAGRRLDHWYFSWLGDEVSFFEGARRLIHGTRANIFDLSYVHSKNPLADSLYQSLFMRALGEHVIGWRLAEVAVAVTAALLTYLAVVCLNESAPTNDSFRRRFPAIIAGLVVGGSAYTLAFSHIGYTNLHTLVPPLFVVLILIGIASRPSAVRVFALGCLLGLCLYTFLATLVFVAVAVLYFLPNLAARPKGGRLASAVIAGAGFCATTLPIFANGQQELLQNLRASNAIGRATEGGLLQGWFGSVSSFWHNSSWFNHHIASSLLDPVAAAFAAVGFGAAVLAVRRSSWDRFLLLWFALGTLVVAATHPEPWPSFTRLLVVLPAVALLAARGAGVMLAVLEVHLGFSRRLTQILMAAAALGIAVLNPLQLYSIVPLRLPPDPATTAVRALQEHPRAHVVEVTYEIDGNRAVSLLPYPKLARRYSWITGAQLMEGSEHLEPGTIFLVYWSRRLAATVAEFTGPSWRPYCYSEYRGGCRVWIFEPTTPASR